MTGKPMFDGDPLARNPTSAVQTWLLRRMGKRVWFTLTAIFACCFIGGAGLLIAGQNVPGIILLLIAILMVLLTSGAMMLALAISGVMLLFAARLSIGTSARAEPQQAVEVPDDIAEIARQLAINRQKLSEASRWPIVFGVVIGVILASTLTWGILESPNPAYWFIPVAFVLFPVAGGAIGGNPTQQAFRQRYKAELLPAVIARYGALAPVAPGLQPDFAAAQRAGVMWRYHRLTIDDGFSGTYRGYPLEIYDLRLWRGDVIFKENTKKGTSAARLAVRIELERSIRATTAVTDEAGFTEDARSRDERLQPLQLEDPLFERVYAVHSTDEMGARVMLTPAIMERMLAFADGTGFSPPSLLAEGRHLLFVLQYHGSLDLFEPMSVSEDLPLHLLRTDRELKTVFGMVDVMIEMAEAVVGPRTGATNRPPR